MENFNNNSSKKKMIDFIYPTINDNEDGVSFTGCGKFSISKEDDVSFDAHHDDDLGFIKRDFSILFPGWLTRNQIFDIPPEGRQDVQGFSKGLAYFLTLAKLSKSLRPDILKTGKNIWCTGVINPSVDKKPVLDRVTTHLFDEKLAGFLSEEKNSNNDFLFIAQESNISSKQEEIIKDANAVLCKLSDLKNKKHLSFKEKTVLIVHADQLKDIVNFLFITKSKTSFTPTKKYAVLAVILVSLFSLFFFNGKILLPLKVNEHKSPLEQLTPEFSEILELAYTKKLVNSPVVINAVFQMQSIFDKAAWIPIQNGDTLTTNDRYKIILSSSSSAYIYVFQIDTLGKLDWLFPKNSNKHSRGKNPIPEMAAIHLPNKGKVYELNDNLGVEHLYIIATKNRWIELEEKLSELGGKTISKSNIKVAFQKGTRGVGGISNENENLSLVDMPKGSLMNILESKDGVAVLERWFNHLE
jgi:hypothetical protein